MSILTVGFLMKSCAIAVTTGVATTTYVAVRDKTLSKSYADYQIFCSAKNKLFAGDHKYLFYHLDLKVHNGEVYIVGNVKNEQHKQFVIDSIKKIEGVTKIFDEMSIKSQVLFSDDFSTSFKDSILTIRTKIILAFAKDIKSINYSLETFEGVTYIVGNASSIEESEKVTEILSKKIGAENFVNYLIVNSVPQ